MVPGYINVKIQLADSSSNFEPVSPEWRLVSELIKNNFQDKCRIFDQFISDCIIDSKLLDSIFTSVNLYDEWIPVLNGSPWLMRIYLSNYLKPILESFRRNILLQDDTLPIAIKLPGWHFEFPHRPHMSESIFRNPMYGFGEQNDQSILVFLAMMMIKSKKAKSVFMYGYIEKEAQQAKKFNGYTIVISDEKLSDIDLGPHHVLAFVYIYNPSELASSVDKVDFGKKGASLYETIKIMDFSLNSNKDEDGRTIPTPNLRFLLRMRPLKDLYRLPPQPGCIIS